MSKPRSLALKYSWLSAGTFEFLSAWTWASHTWPAAVRIASAALVPQALRLLGAAEGREDRPPHCRLQFLPARGVQAVEGGEVGDRRGRGVEEGVDGLGPRSGRRRLGGRRVERRRAPSRGGWGKPDHVGPRANGLHRLELVGVEDVALELGISEVAEPLLDQVDLERGVDLRVGLGDRERRHAGGDLDAERHVLRLAAGRDAGLSRDIALEALARVVVVEPKVGVGQEVEDAGLCERPARVVQDYRPAAGWRG